MTPFSLLHYSVEDGIADIILDNPPANVINPEMMTEYFAALDQANADFANAQTVPSARRRHPHKRAKLFLRGVIFHQESVISEPSPDNQ